MPAQEAAPSAAVTPGTISKGTPAAASSSASSPPRLEPHHAAPGEGALEHLRVQLVAGRPVAVTAAHREPLGARGRERQERLGHELVVGEHVGAAQEPVRAHREQLGIARAGADQVDAPGAHDVALSFFALRKRWLKSAA